MKEGLYDEKGEYCSHIMSLIMIDMLVGQYPNDDADGGWTTMQA
jgi:hypothetical protein